MTEITERAHALKARKAAKLATLSPEAARAIEARPIEDFIIQVLMDDSVQWVREKFMAVHPGWTEWPDEPLVFTSPVQNADKIALAQAAAREVADWSSPEQIGITRMTQAGVEAIAHTSNFGPGVDYTLVMPSLIWSVYIPPANYVEANAREWFIEAHTLEFVPFDKHSSADWRLTVKPDRCMRCLKPSDTLTRKHGYRVCEDCAR